MFSHLLCAAQKLISKAISMHCLYRVVYLVEAVGTGYVCNWSSGNSFESEVSPCEAVSVGREWGLRWIFKQASNLNEMMIDCGKNMKIGQVATSRPNVSCFPLGRWFNKSQSLLLVSFSSIRPEILYLGSKHAIMFVCTPQIMCEWMRWWRESSQITDPLSVKQIQRMYIFHPLK